MRVKVFAPFFADRSCLEADGWITVEDNCSLTDVLKMMRFPKALAKMMMVSINGVRSATDTVLEDGDVVGFFTLISGG
jgi:molybdopterin converting factor small subunit